MRYETIKIDNQFILSIKEWSKEASQVLDYCLSNNLWIAGGFARKIYEMYTFKRNQKVSIMHYFFKSSGDIDLFGKKEDITCNSAYFYNFFTESESDELIFHENIYTNNLAFRCESKLCKEESLGLYTRSNIVLQLINKIDHENIFDCLESFDLTNSKYCVYKENNDIFLTFSKDAIYYDSNKELDISHSNTPYLAQRIIKYIKKRGLNKISNRSRDKIKTFLINVISNNWNEYIHSLSYNEISNIHLDIIKLNNLIKLSDEEIIIMLGKINIALAYNDDYSSFILKDWATEAIKKEK